MKQTDKKEKENTQLELCKRKEQANATGLFAQRGETWLSEE